MERPTLGLKRAELVARQRGQPARQLQALVTRRLRTPETAVVQRVRPPLRYAVQRRLQAI
jgi:hypothetical protein